MATHSPLESLVAFMLAFMAGVVTCIGLRLYIDAVKREAVAMNHS